MPTISGKRGGSAGAEPDRRGAAAHQSSAARRDSRAHTAGAGGKGPARDSAAGRAEGRGRGQGSPGAETQWTDHRQQAPDAR